MAEEKKGVAERKASPAKLKGVGPEAPDIRSLFEDQMFFDLFNARCHDTGEKPLCNSDQRTFRRDGNELQGRTAEEECKNYRDAKSPINETGDQCHNFVGQLFPIAKSRLFLYHSIDRTAKLGRQCYF